MKGLSVAFTLLLSALVATYNFRFAEAVAGDPIVFVAADGAALVQFVIKVQEQFKLDKNKKGFIDANTQVLSPEVFTFLEGSFRFILEFKVVQVVNNVLVGAVPKNIQDNLNDLFVEVQFNGNQNLNEAIAANFNVIANNAGLLGAQKDDLRLFSAILAANELNVRGPRMYCLFNKQCVGNRDDKGFGETIQRICNGADNAGKALEPGVVVPDCDSFVAFFSLQWLLAWIIGVYVILILWALYWLYPWLKRKCCGSRGDAERADKAKPEYNSQEQLIINTLAAQAASAENLLFQATDMLKLAVSQKHILNVETRRENRVMTLACEYFQALAAIMVTLTHQYLDRKTNTPGEKFNDEDPAVRALQLEVLNYVRDRLQLAFSADALTEKSLLRIAEAYAICKRVSDALVLVGFSYDKEHDESLGQLRTPIVDLGENSIFLSGIFKGARGGLDRDIDGSEVCIPIQNTDTRGMKAVGALYYLSDSARAAKNYDPHMQTVVGKDGQQLVYALANAGSQGETLQYFVRTFWGPEIAQIQQEASSWLTSDNSLEAWLERERLEREQKAAPVIKRGAKKKRKKNKKGGKKDKYKDIDETQTEVTEYTEASGWSVTSNNTYVYSINSVVNQGLGIAGKPGMPFDRLGANEKKVGRVYALFQSYFPNFAEWPKFYFIIFILMPIIIALPMMVKIGRGAGIIDIDGNVAFKARGAGLGISFLGVPAYYFLDGDVPEVGDLEAFQDFLDEPKVIVITESLGLTENNGATIVNAEGPFGDGKLLMSNTFVLDLFDAFDGASGRKPDDFTTEIQAGVLVQSNVAELDAIRSQQKGQEFGTPLIYALMHNAGYFFGIIPISLVRESLEILARRFSFIRDIYPMSQWRELHMNLGLAGIFYVTFGATVFLVMLLVSLGKSTPFAGLAGDPNIGSFFDLNANVLYLRQLLLPAVPLLLLMKYAARGPPAWVRKFAPNFITKNYWEICYFLHYTVAFTAIIMLVLYRPQVFYWMGATWGFIWGGNKIVRILRTRKTTIKNTELISYAVEDKRNNSKKRTDVLRLTLNVPKSFPSSSRGQACWLTIPEIDFIAHPFTLAKVPTKDDMSIMFHIGIKYLAGDDIISYARPEATSVRKDVAPPRNPNELPPGWKSAVDPESGQTYYYNSAERKTTWTFPKLGVTEGFFEGARALTSRFSTAMLRGAGSTRLGQVGLDTNGRQNTIRQAAALTNRATWTQKLAKLAEKIQTMDPEMRRNQVKDYPVYVSAPLGTSMDDCLLPSLPGSIIITTQNGLPAAESSVRWLLKQPREHRPKFHFFVSVSREVNDALSVMETLRDAVCEAVVNGHLDIDGLNVRHAHMADWLGVYIHLTQRKPSQIVGDREMLLKSLNPPQSAVSAQQLEVIETWLKNRVCSGRLDFDRFLKRANQMVLKRTGLNKINVGYCGSAKIAYAIRAATRQIPDMKFDGEYI